MKSAGPLSSVFLTFMLVIVAVIPADDKFSFQFTLYDQVKGVSENELDLDCENNAELCLIEACLGSECSKIANGLGISQMLAGDKLLGKNLIKTDVEDNCQTVNGKEEISNFNFYPSIKEPKELDSNNNKLEKPSHGPAARWYNVGSDLLIDLDLGTVKEICNVGISFNDNDDDEIGYSVTLSNSSTRNLNEAVPGSTSSLLVNSESNHDFGNLAGRFVHLTIPDVSEFYVDDDEDDPVVTEIEVKALPFTQTTRNSDVHSKSTENITSTTPPAAVDQLEVSPLEFLDNGSDLLNTPMPGPKHYGMNQSSLPDMSSPLISNVYTGDILLP
jgi:hypothetical protein